MNLVKSYFEELGFDFKVDFTNLSDSFLYNNKELKARLINKVFLYENKNQANTSFYLLSESVENKDLKLFRNYIWNENKVDLFFYPIFSYKKNTLFNNEFELNLIYAKATPKDDTISIESGLLATFSNKDKEKIKEIEKWQFDSGAFWFNYHSALEKANLKTIDKELINVLTNLKNKLYKELSKLIIEDETKLEKTVQALIDRTLYIKYLEDNHIINSDFNTFYFQSSEINYSKLLEDANPKKLNFLFEKVHEIFHNTLFDNPVIEDKYLTKNICNLILQSFNTNVKGQLKLFDFKFDVIPVEFISYIYEIFLEEKQKKDGIYYTPKKLAQLIVDDVILDNKIGTVLDSACGSGMFLIVAFQKLLEIDKPNEPQNDIAKIKRRVKLLSNNIFGIELQPIARRFTIFSLSLQLFRGLDPEKIKKYIAEQLKLNRSVDLFTQLNLAANILEGNSLALTDSPFQNRTFDYIVGNPPFKSGKEVSQEAKDFTNTYKLEQNGSKIEAKNIIGNYQISQCFLLKIQEWSNENTRFGMVSNSSNFYTNAQKFEKFFYTNYNIEKIYELSRVQNILFAGASESVVSLIFSNKTNAQNTIAYYPVKMGLFSEKPFNLLIIQEDTIIELPQNDLVENKIKLRDYLVGNEYDRKLSKIISSQNPFSNFTNNKKEFSVKGAERITNTDLFRHYNINSTLKSKEIENLHQKFAFENYLSAQISEKYNTKYILKPEGIIRKFKLDGIKLFTNLNLVTNQFFQRERDIKIYQGEKILINKFGNSIKAVYVKEDVVFSNYIYGFKLQNNKQYYLFTAILNSKIIEYYIENCLKNRLDNNFESVTVKSIKNIPIPKNLDEDLVAEISAISKDLTDVKYTYEEKEEELNELIYDLYDLSSIERQRVKDYFIKQAVVKNTGVELEKYKTTLINSIGFYFKEEISVEFSENNPKTKLIVAKVYFKKQQNKSSDANKVAKFYLSEIFKNYSNNNFLSVQEKVFGKDCVYIVKDNKNTSWSKTKAYEDGQDIIKHIIG